MANWAVGAKKSSGEIKDSSGETALLLALKRITWRRIVQRKGKKGYLIARSEKAVERAGTELPEDWKSEAACQIVAG